VQALLELADCLGLGGDLCRVSVNQVLVVAVPVKFRAHRSGLLVGAELCIRKLGAEAHDFVRVARDSAHVDAACAALKLHLGAPNALELVRKLGLARSVVLAGRSELSAQAIDYL